MKKLTSVILLIILVILSFTLASCKNNNEDGSQTQTLAVGDTVATLNGKTPEEICAAVKKVLSEMTQYDVTINAEGEGDIDGSVKLTTSARMRISSNGSYVKTTTEQSGKTVVYESTYIDGIEYVNDSERGKYKYDRSADSESEASASGNNMSAAGVILYANSEYFDFSGASFKWDGELYELKLEMLTEKAKLYILKGDFNYEPTEDVNLDELVPSAYVSLILRLDGQGNLKELEVEWSATINSEGAKGTTSMSQKIVFNSIGSADKVSAPADADAYVWATDDDTFWSNGSGDDDEAGASNTFDTLNGKTPKQLYDATQALLSQMTKYDISCLGSTTVKVGTLSVDYDTSMSVRRNGSAIYAKGDRTGTGVNTEYVYVDGVAYVNDGTDKIKYEDITLEDFEETFDIAYVVADDWVSSEYLDFSDAVFTCEGELYSVELIASSENARRYLESAMELDSVDAASLSVKVYFDEQGNVEEYTVELWCTEEYEFDVTVRFFFNSIGSAEAISAPYDAQSYVKALDIGDVDGDGNVDDFDEFIVDYIFGSTSDVEADDNGDGIVDINDMLSLFDCTLYEWQNEIVPNFASMWNNGN